MALLQRPRQSTQYSVVVVTLAMYTANIFTVFDCVPISTIISLRGVSGSQKNGAAAAGGAFYSAKKGGGQLPPLPPPPPLFFFLVFLGF